MRAFAKKEWVWVLVIVALGVFFRFYHITALPPGLYPDEAVNGNNALEALATGDFKVFYPENNGREGLFINIQAISVHFFGNFPWALRVVSACFGSLTILGVWLLTKELFYERARRGKHTELWATAVPLASAFFIATGYWHIQFSRIGFRAIMIPFALSFGFYWLLKGLRTGKITSMVAAGIFIGVGFHTYIAFRFVPFMLAFPLLWYLWQWLRKNTSIANHCIPCSIALFLFITFIVALPIGIYFLQHPADFIGRGDQVSIFSSDSPLREFTRSNVLTLGMFNIHGDCNPRHNFQCMPELFFPVGLFFLLGFGAMVRGLFRKTAEHRLPALVLASWFVFMMFPVTLTREGLPHALRSIGLIPVAFVLAGLGLGVFWEYASGWLEKGLANPNLAKKHIQLLRIRKELLATLALVFAVTTAWTYQEYFVEFASSPETETAFASDLTNIGYYLKALPQDTKKYVIVNLDGVDIRGFPTPTQTVMYLTDTFREARRREEQIVYLHREDLSQIPHENGKMIVIPLNIKDTALIKELATLFPELRVVVPGDFIVFSK